MPLKTKIAVFVFLIFTLQLFAPPRKSNNLVLSFDLDWKGKAYTAHCIIPSYLVSDGNSWDRMTELRESNKKKKVPSEYTDRELLQAVEDFVIEQYRERGLLEGEKGQEMERALRTQESIHKGRSAVVMISTRESPREIQSVARVDGTNKKQPLMDFESRLLGKGLDKPVPRPVPKESSIGKEQMFHLDLRELGSEVNEFVLYYFEGPNALPRPGIAELKNFVRSPDSPDFVPILLALLEGLGGAQFTGSRNGRGTEAIGEYWLECDGKVRQDYFTRQGWKTFAEIANPDIPGNTTYLMRIPRKDFVEKLAKRIFSREEGLEMMQNVSLRLRENQWKDVRCRGIFNLLANKGRKRH